jgi:K+-sensing histidine kinase KdpD
MPFGSEDLLKLITLGFWFPIVIIFSGFIAFQLYRQMIERRYSYRERHERAVEFEFYGRELRQSLEEVLESVKKQRSFIERLFELIPERISTDMHRQWLITGDRLGQELSKELSKEISQSFEQLAASIHHDVEAAKGTPLSLGTASEGVDLELRQNFIRQISHALYTPLSRIDAITTNVITVNPDDAIAEKMANAKSAVEICYAYLAAYRKIITAAETGSYWSPQSLKEAIVKSAKVFIGASAKNVVMKVEAPASVRSPSTIYILAVLLPLIENAIDASLDDDPVEFNVQDLADGVEANITNVLHEPFAGQKVFDPGFTTKKASSDGGSPIGMNAHEGLGLTIVGNLLSAVPGGQITYKADAESVTFTVKLPGQS